MLTGGGARHDDTGIRPDDGIDGFIMCDFKGDVKRRHALFIFREVGYNENNNDVSGDISCDCSDCGDVRMYR